MNSGLTSTLSEFNQRSEFSRSGLASAPSDGTPRRPAERNPIAGARSWLGKLVSSTFARALIIFFIGVAAGLAWQSYSSEARKAIAGWSPRLAWLAPKSAGTSAERLKATSLALASVRQSVDKLETEIDKLQAQGAADQRSGSRRASQRR